MKRSPSLGPTIQSRPDFCPACDGRRIIKRGLRKNSFRHLQIYWCKDCGGYFVSLVGLKGVKYPPRVIARTLCLYNLGHSQEAAARRIVSENRITVPRRTISHWISGYRSVTTFHRFRAAAILQFGSSMLRERALEHQQTYQYKVHLAKLALTAGAIPADTAVKVKNYLFSVFEDFPDSLFQEDANLDQQAAPDDRPPQQLPAMRSSKSRFEMLPFALIEKQNLANDLAAFGLLLARSVLDTVPQVAWHPAILVAWNTGEIRLALRNSSLPEPPLRSTLGIGTGRAAACVSARNCLERQANRRRRSDQARTS